MKPASPEKDPFAPEFRVVARGNVRRGIRLERIFWTTLKRMAESRKITMGALIEEIAARFEMLAEEIREQAIAQGTAIEGDWL